MPKKLLSVVKDCISIYKYLKKVKSKFYPVTVDGVQAVVGGAGGQSHALAALPPGKRPGTHCTGDWLGPFAGLDGFGKSPSHPDSSPGPSSL